MIVIDLNEEDVDNILMKWKQMWFQHFCIVSEWNENGELNWVEKYCFDEVYLLLDTELYESIDEVNEYMKWEVRRNERM